MAFSIPSFLLLITASASPLRSYAFSTPAGPTSSSSPSSPSYSRRTVRPTCDARRGGSSDEGRRRRRYREVDCGPGIVGAGEGGSRSSSAPMPSRRRVVASAAAAVATVHNMLLSADAVPIPSSSTTRPAPEEGKVYVRGRATLQSPDLFDDVLAAGRTANSDNGAALYVTARPSRPDSVPAAVLDGSRGRPPPVLSARYPKPDFPFDFELTPLDLTPEGAAASAMTTTATAVDDGRDGVWWAGEDLVVSARLDTDGVASTRDPTDLVGRGIFRPPPVTPTSTAAAFATAPATVVSIELRGRGMFGKSVTGRK